MPKTVAKGLVQPKNKDRNRVHVVVRSVVGTRRTRTRQKHRRPWVTGELCVGVPQRRQYGPFPAIEHAGTTQCASPCAIPALGETGWSSYELGNMKTELRARGLTTILPARTQRERAIGHHQE